MENLFEVVDKTGRIIRLTKRQWSHISSVHSEIVNYFEEIKKTLEKPIKIIPKENENMKEYYSYQKNRNFPEKYLRLIFKYLNGDGFIITAHFVRNVK